MDESNAEFRARQVLAQVKPSSIPVRVEDYVQHVGAVLRFDKDLEPDIAGWAFQKNGKHYICVNANDDPERQRFTVCHELGHIVLGLPSEHEEQPSWSVVKKSQNEILCDIFAAELLLPWIHFQPLVARADTCLASIDALAERAVASFSATGSRYAALSAFPCAFVFSQGGKIRYASRSKVLREANGWIPPRAALPTGSLSEQLRAGLSSRERQEIAADRWFSDWRREGVLFEEARHVVKWDQTLTLLWFEDEDLPPPPRGSEQEGDEEGLRELDGTLPWPGRKRRK